MQTRKEFPLPRARDEQFIIRSRDQDSYTDCTSLTAEAMPPSSSVVQPGTAAPVSSASPHGLSGALSAVQSLQYMGIDAKLLECASGGPNGNGQHCLFTADDRESEFGTEQRLTEPTLSFTKCLKTSLCALSARTLSHHTFSHRAQLREFTSAANAMPTTTGDDHV